MSQAESETLKRTPFYDIHKKSGARLIDFGGYAMPVQYSGIRQEHIAVREHAGLFDVSHMGEIRVSGDKALEFIQRITVNDASILVNGRAQYSVMCYEDGGIVDDLLVYRLDDEEYMLVVNAANREKDWAWMQEQNSAGARLDDISDDTCLLALQGPDAARTLRKLTHTDLASIGFYRFVTGTVAGYDNIIISETGYTGEKGFELYFNRNTASPEKIWEQIMTAGSEFGIRAAGLGARDTLRLEMGYALYGNDITSDTNPLEAGLGWLVHLEKGPFIGSGALEKIKKKGPGRKLRGFIMNGPRAIPRAHYEIQSRQGTRLGEVTSGTMSITLNKGIGMGYVPIDQAEEGNEVYVHIRNQPAPATIMKPPFIRKK